MHFPNCSVEWSMLCLSYGAYNGRPFKFFEVAMSIKLASHT